MKKLGFALLLLAFALDANGADYKSNFGFKFQVPKTWVVLTKDEVTKKGESWSSDTRTPFLTPEQNQMMIDKMLRGEVEFYYNQATANDVFTDNIVVDRKSGRVPYKNELREYCDQTRKVLSKMFSKEIAIYECRLLVVSNKATLYIVADGPIQETRNIYYSIQSTPDSIIGLTLSTKPSTFPANKADFEALIKSIRF